MLCFHGQLAKKMTKAEEGDSCSIHNQSHKNLHVHLFLLLPAAKLKKTGRKCEETAIYIINEKYKNARVNEAHEKGAAEAAPSITLPRISHPRAGESSPVRHHTQGIQPQEAPTAHRGWIGGDAARMATPTSSAIRHKMLRGRRRRTP